jgi:hypothetical protein
MYSIRHEDIGRATAQPQRGLRKTSQPDAGIGPYRRRAARLYRERITVEQAKNEIKAALAGRETIFLDFLRARLRPRTLGTPIGSPDVTSRLHGYAVLLQHL